MMYSRRMDNYETYSEEALIRREIIRKRKSKMRRRRIISAALALLLTVAGALALGKFIGTKAYDKYNVEPVNVMSDLPIVNAAKSGIGNLDGGPYWSWYGFGSRVEWCACFTSWAENESGALDAGTAPKFAYVPDGVTDVIALHPASIGGIALDGKNLIIYDRCYYTYVIDSTFLQPVEEY